VGLAPTMRLDHVIVVKLLLVVVIIAKYIKIIYSKYISLNFWSIFQLFKNTTNINANHLRVFLNAFGVF
jgi:hypothetical protein